ncbi:hypothetical protein Pan216_09520 [Planctomycetes bacterium Pan216]|uniref:Uncharacterized protein n=1 Tax=Kolteria novifilia TaxID=2527975 RepID=A0A518AZG9_9BACT|nr:hypothetical protein Pan216_09520 [Planctomycetes bacterium Pan216]
MRASRLWGAVCLVGVLSFGSVRPSGADEHNAGVAARLPAGALATVEVEGLAAVVERLLASDYAADLQQRSLLAPLRKTEGYRRAIAAKRMVEYYYGMSLRDLSRDLFGGSIGVALYPPEDDEKPELLIVAHPSNKKAFDEVLGRTRTLLVAVAADKMRESKLIDGTSLTAVDDKVYFGVREGWLVVATTERLAGQAVALLGGDGEVPSLAEDDAYRRVTKRLGRGGVIRGTVKRAFLEAASKGKFPPSRFDNALAALLFGGIFEMMGESSMLAWSLGVAENDVSLTLAIPGDVARLPERYAGYFADSNKDAAPGIPRIKGEIAGLTMYRDLASLYRGREELMEERILPNFDKFESGLGNLLPGKSFAEDVLPNLGKRFVILASTQSYEHLDGKPGVQLPAFALVADSSSPDASDLYQLLFQTVVSIGNLTVGKRGGEPWIMTGEQYEGVQISYCRFLNRPAGEELPFINNFTPASALVKDRYIISSSLELCRQLVGHYQGKDTPATENSDDNVKLLVQADTLANILDRNKHLLEARMIQEGTPAPAAKARLAFALEWLTRLDQFQLTSKVEGDGLDLRAEVSWK